MTGPEHVHLQFGADAARQVVASWTSRVRARQPRLRLRLPRGAFGPPVDAVERSYEDALTGERVWTYHAPLDNLEPDTIYSYEVAHRRSAAFGGRFRTSPSGRSRPFRFSSFGDLGIPCPVGAGSGPSSPNAAYAVDAVESVDPLFHLVNGDLSYANVSDAPAATWDSYFANTMRSARNRPWMPCAGNHENEVGNGPNGYLAYQTRFFLPDNGAPPDFIGNWYAFTAGAVRFVVLNGDDVCIQDGAFSADRADKLPFGRQRDSYIRGYSGGAQRMWLAATLAAARADLGIDWVVVVMHQVAMCSTPFNGADLGLRQEFLPLFDEYGVDLVLSGHEHYYQRTHPVRGVVPGSRILTPAATPSGRDGAVDTTRGAVHLVMGVGGHPTHLPSDAFRDPAAGTVITAAGPAVSGAGRTARKESEPADWLAFRAPHHPYGLTVFDVDPGAAGGMTRIRGVHYGARAGSPVYEPVDAFVLERPRTDALTSRRSATTSRAPE